VTIWYFNKYIILFKKQIFLASALHALIRGMCWHYSSVREGTFGCQTVASKAALESS